MPEDLGSVWYVIREHKTDRATVVAGPIDDVGEARRRASMEALPAEPMLGIWLVYNIEAEDYEVDWADGVDRPEATVEPADGGDSETHA